MVKLKLGQELVFTSHTELWDVIFIHVMLSDTHIEHKQLCQNDYIYQKRQ